MMALVRARVFCNNVHYTFTVLLLICIRFVIFIISDWVTMDSLSPAKRLPGGHKAMADLVGDWMRKKGLGFVEERKSNIESEAKYGALILMSLLQLQQLSMHSRRTHFTLSLSLPLHFSLSLSLSPSET